MYRLRKGEALYSAVVVRFTGRLDAADVNDLALKLAQRSGIADVHTIPVGFPVKIPVEFLSDDFLPKDDARFRENWAHFLRIGASPSAVHALTGMNAEIDIRPILPTVAVPTSVGSDSQRPGSIPSEENVECAPEVEAFFVAWT